MNIVRIQTLHVTPPDHKTPTSPTIAPKIYVLRSYSPPAYDVQI